MTGQLSNMKIMPDTSTELLPFIGFGCWSGALFRTEEESRQGRDR